MVDPSYVDTAEARIRAAGGAGLELLCGLVVLEDMPVVPLEVRPYLGPLSCPYLAPYLGPYLAPI